MTIRERFTHAAKSTIAVISIIVVSGVVIRLWSEVVTRWYSDNMTLGVIVGFGVPLIILWFIFSLISNPDDY